MSTLLDILSHESIASGCGRADLRKALCGAASESATICGLAGVNPHNPQTVADRGVLSQLVFRKSASPQGVGAGSQHSPQARLSESALQAFIELVRATGASKHQILLHREEIDSQLDTDDIQELLENDRAYRQDWAELLAYRLCMNRLGQ